MHRLLQNRHTARTAIPQWSLLQRAKTNRGAIARKQWRIVRMLPWPALREFVSGALIAIGELPSDGRPDWAVKAARKACIDVLGLPKSAKRKSLEMYGEGSISQFD